MCRVMSIVRRAALLAPLFVLIACGGTTSRFDQSDAGDDGSPPPGCPAESTVGAGGSCNDEGAQCPGTVNLPTCNGSESTTTATCTCSSGTWACPVAEGIECPVPDPGCPSPGQVTQGAYCANTPGTSCVSNIPIPTCNGPSNGFESCTCDNSQWECPVYAGLCPDPVEAGTCPPPTEVWSGQGCATYGTTCQGDPQVCDGTSIFDTLQCVAGTWNVVASTYCDVYDGGYPDAQFGADAGKGI
jgi:hypothetical protein